MTSCRIGSGNKSAGTSMSPLRKKTTITKSPMSITYIYHLYLSPIYITYIYHLYLSPRSITYIPHQSLMVGPRCVDRLP